MIRKRKENTTSSNTTSLNIFAGSLDMGSGYKVESFKAKTIFFWGGRSEGRITHEAIKADQNREVVRRLHFILGY
jgi:hypothetical protein